MAIKLSKDEASIFNDLNNFRVNPSSYTRNFELLSKGLSRVRGKQDVAKELLEYSKTLREKTGQPAFVLSNGLCKVARAELDHISKIGSAHRIKLTDDDLRNHANSHVTSYTKIFEVMDHGNIENLIARSMISDHDPKRTYRTAFLNEYYKYIGIASVEIEDETTSVVIFADNVKEKQEGRPHIDPADYDEIKQAFDLFDIYEIGKIDPKETKKAMKDLNFNVKHPVIYEIINKLDSPDFREGVEWDDFVYAILDEIGDDKSDEGLYRIFSLYKDDPNQDIITLGALKKIIAELGERASLAEVNELIRNTSSKGNYVTWEEFREAFTVQN